MRPNPAFDISVPKYVRGSAHRTCVYVANNLTIINCPQFRTPPTLEVAVQHRFQTILPIVNPTSCVLAPPPSKDNGNIWSVQFQWFKRSRGVEVRSHHDTVLQMLVCEWGEVSHA